MGRTNSIIWFRVKESGADRSLSQGTVASTFFTEQDEKSGHLTPSSGFSPPFLLFGFQGRIRGRGLWGWRWRQQDMADASRPAFLLPQLTVFSNTKEAWEWHTHSPDQYNEFSISAYIMALCMKQPFFLSQFMLAVHSQPVPSTPREKKNPALKKNDENTK